MKPFQFQQEESKADETLPLLQGDEDDRSSMRPERSFEEILKEAANSPLPWDAEDDEDWEAAPSQEVNPSVDEVPFTVHLSGID